MPRYTVLLHEREWYKRSYDVEADSPEEAAFLAKTSPDDSEVDFEYLETDKVEIISVTLQPELDPVLALFDEYKMSRDRTKYTVAGFVRFGEDPTDEVKALIDAANEFLKRLAEVKS